MLWILMDFIPAGFIRWLIHLILLGGLALIVASTLVHKLTAKWLTSIPMLAVFLRGVGFLLFIAGVFLEGGYGVEIGWRTKVELMQARVAEAEAKSDAANQQIESEHQAAQERIRKAEEDLRTAIGAQKTVINQACKLDPVAVDLYNRAIKGNGGKQ